MAHPITPVSPTAGNEESAPSTPAQDASEVERALFEVKRVIVGQDRMIERMFTALLARGHCLLEGVPGVAKTLAVSTMARVTGGTFRRLQFTPDLVPADIVGTRIWRPSREEFDIEWGPIFANMVLADDDPLDLEEGVFEQVGRGAQRVVRRRGGDRGHQRSCFG